MLLITRKQARGGALIVPAPEK